MNKLREFWKDARQFPSHFIAVVSPLVVIAIQALGLLPDPNLSYTLTIMAFVLGIVAWNNLQENKKINQILAHVHQIEVQNIIWFTPSNSRQFDAQRDDIVNSASHKVYALLRYGDSLHDKYSYSKLPNVDIEIILCDPTDKNLMQMLAARAPSTDYAKNGVKIIKNSLRLIALGAEERKQNNHPSMTVRTLNHLPPFILIAKDMDSSSRSGEILVSISGFKVDHSKSPLLHLKQGRDELLFDFFKNEFKKYWEIAKENKVD